MCFERRKNSAIPPGKVKEKPANSSLISEDFSGLPGAVADLLCRVHWSCTFGERSWPENFSLFESQTRSMTDGCSRVFLRLCSFGAFILWAPSNNSLSALLASHGERRSPYLLCSTGASVWFFFGNEPYHMPKGSTGRGSCSRGM